MDITWLFLVLSPYMLLYFYLTDYTSWSQRKIILFWTCGFLVIVGVFWLINYLNPIHPPFPKLFY